ncbi:MAG: 2-oxoacid:acceptor oxidoreductase family protein [Candidatus Alcyoniella australis]|nr:2-oxoacid:acceptor oxidoreductase family protein [Candidatus Alcyoniella australis]
MIEIRFHGRGGQGAVTSAELLAQAAIGEGKYAQAFPSFGPERRGAPVLAFARIDEQQIRSREQVYEPDVVIVLDQALLSIVDVEAGIREGGLVVINSGRSAAELRQEYKLRSEICLVDATQIAMEVLKRPITNTTMLGAMLKGRNLVELESLRAPLEHRFGALAARNFDVMSRAFEQALLEKA